MKILTCPDLETLESFLLGKLPAEQSEQLDEHLLSCEKCAAQLDTASASDEFTAALKLKQELQTNEHLNEAMDHCKQLVSETDTVESEETAVVDRRTQQPDESQAAETAPSVEVSAEKKRPETKVDFLRPAEQPDEIGRLGDYRVLEILGVGGMGIVFRAEDIKLKREVALKAMKPEIAALDSAKQRFIREAQATAAIEHDHIVQIYQVGEDQGVPFIAMQFLRGESLEDKLKREKKLEELEVATIGKQIALGLAEAHQHKLVHRDIKPDNIWIDEKTGRAKILDFGLVRTVSDEESGLTQSGMVIGTPKYMAPEQAKGEKIDARCDLFSLGSVLYHLATGKPAFQGKNMTATLMAVSYNDPKPIEERNPSLNPELASVITHLLAKDPDERLHPAEEVAKQLGQIEERLKQQIKEAAEPDETVSLERAPAQPQAASRTPIFIGGSVVAVALGLFFILWQLGIIFSIETEDGTIQIVIDNSTEMIEINVDKDKITIEDPNDGQEITVTVDREKKQLHFVKQGFVATMTSFSLSSPDGRKVVEVKFIPKPEVAEVKPAMLETSAGQNYALSFDGKQANVRFPNYRYQLTKPFTLEVHTTPYSFAEKETGLIFGHSELALRMQPDGRWLFAQRTEDVRRLIYSDSKSVLNQRTHLAGVFDGSTLRFFVNGKQQGEEIHDCQMGDIEAWFTSGAIRDDNPESINMIRFFHGKIDETRFSSTARYTEDFTPEPHFENDEHTLALYHFDTGTGNVLKDASGNGHHGKIVGATWVKVDE